MLILVLFKKEILSISYSFLKRDLEYYLKDVKSLIIFLTVFLSGLLVFLASLKNMLGGSDNYFVFLLVGYLVVSYMNISAGSGFELINESYEGKLQYDKTLPINRKLYSIIRLFGISLRGYINFLFCLLIIFPLLLPYFTLGNLLIFLISSLILAVIFTGICLIPIVFTKNLTIQSVIGSVLRSWFFLGSTIFYPYDTIPNFLKLVVILNPVTWILDLIRTSMKIPFSSHLPLEVSIIVIGTYLLISLFGGIKVLETYNHEE